MRFHAYSVCMMALLQRSMFIRIMMGWTVPCVVGVLVVVFVWLLTRFRKQPPKHDLPSRISRDDNHKEELEYNEEKIRENYNEEKNNGEGYENCEEDKYLQDCEENVYYEGNKTVVYQNEGIEKVQVPGENVKCDESFLRLEVPFLSRQELRRLRSGPILGVGGFGSVWQATYDGSDAVVKQLIDRSHLVPLLMEARIMVELNGAGGAPQLLAVCKVPPALVQEFVGNTYDEYLMTCSVQDFLKSLLSVFQRVGEIHAKGYVHNDLKMNNITFTGTVCRPVFHIIDFGWACHLGQPAIHREVKHERAAKRKANHVINDVQNYDYIFTSDVSVTDSNTDETNSSYKVVEGDYS